MGDEREEIALIQHQAHTFCQPMAAKNQVWMLRFCDQDMGDMIWDGPDAREQAIKAWNRYNVAWNCYLFSTHDAARAQGPAPGEADHIPDVGKKIIPAPGEAAPDIASRLSASV